MAFRRRCWRLSRRWMTVLTASSNHRKQQRHLMECILIRPLQDKKPNNVFVESEFPSGPYDLTLRCKDLCSQLNGRDPWLQKAKAYIKPTKSKRQRSRTSGKIWCQRPTVLLGCSPWKFARGTSSWTNFIRTIGASPFASCSRMQLPGRTFTRQLP